MAILIALLSVFGSFLLFLATKNIFPVAIHHVVYYCSNVITPFAVAIPAEISSIFLLFLFSVIALSFFRIVKLFLSTLVTFRRIKKQSISPTLIKHLVRKHHLEEYTLLIMNDLPFAFTFGFRHPKIYISTGLLQVLNDREIEAVLLHEEYHRIHHHPSGRLIQNIARIFLPVLPLLGDLIRQQIISEEIQADKAALATIKDTQILFSSFRKLLLPSYRATFFPAFASYDTLEARIMILQNKKQKRYILRRKVIMSILSVCILLCIACTPVRVNGATITNHCTNQACISTCTDQRENSSSVQHTSLPASFLYTSQN